MVVSEYLRGLSHAALLVLISVQFSVAQRRGLRAALTRNHRNQASGQTRRNTQGAVAQSHTNGNDRDGGDLLARDLNTSLMQSQVEATDAGGCVASMEGDERVNHRY